jgi:lysophospholipid hydrolase
MPKQRLAVCITRCRCRWVAADGPEVTTLTLSSQAYDTLGFGKFTEIMGVGLKAGREVLAKWKEEGRLPTGLVDDVKAKQAISRGTRLR